MALVSYDYESESEESVSNEEILVSSVIIPEKNKKLVEEPATALSTQLSHLPKTKKNETPNQIKNDTIEDFIPKYKPSDGPKPPKPKVVITIPSLSQFSDEEDDQPKEKKLKQNVGSGLLSLLPPVKGPEPISVKSFVPNVLKNKRSAQKTPSDLQLIRKKAEIAREKAIKAATKQRNDGSDVETDDEIDLPETFDDDMWSKVCGRPKARPKPIMAPEEPQPTSSAINSAPVPVEPYQGLDNTAFKELVGRSKRPVNIKLVDIHEDDILTEKDLWLTKSITDPDQAPKPVIDNPVDSTRKRKHHITYLAEQAKANAQELETQWSASKLNRNQSRAKYGF